MANRKKLTVLHTDSSLENYNTLYPFLVSREAIDKINFVNFNSANLDKLSGENVLFARLFKGRFENQKFVESTLDKLRQSFDRIYFLDDNDGADSTHFEFIEFLDGYYKTNLLFDTDIYRRKIYRRQVFSDYYHRKYGVKDEDEIYRDSVQDFEQIKKLKPAFNLGCGIYPKPVARSFARICGKTTSRIHQFQLMQPYFRFRHKKLIDELSKPVEYKNKVQKVSARFKYNSYPKSIGYQRFLFENLIKEREQFLTGYIPLQDYLKELKSVFATLSPFGYGEVCFRDFEAIINGSLLLKPDMSHIKTYPDIYRPYETYIPLKWDGSDLLDQVDQILSDPSKYEPVIENSRRVYRNCLMNIEQHVKTFFGSLY